MNYLFKEEPSNYSYDDLARDGRTSWTGVRNPLAQKHLRSVKKGDRIFFYHTGKEKAVVGIAKAADNAYPDPEDKDGNAVRGGRAAGEEARGPGHAGRHQGGQGLRGVSPDADAAAVGDAGDGRRVGADPGEAGIAPAPPG
jgi:hypothetical protein